MLVMYPSMSTLSFAGVAAHWMRKYCCQPTMREVRFPGCQVGGALSAAHPPRAPTSAATAPRRRALRNARNIGWPSHFSALLRLFPACALLAEVPATSGLDPGPGEHGHVIAGCLGHRDVEVHSGPVVDLARTPGDTLPGLGARRVVARHQKPNIQDRKSPCVGDVPLDEGVVVLPRGGPLDVEKLLPADHEGLEIAGLPSHRRGRRASSEEK